MSLDGFTAANIGRNDKTSAQYAEQAEALSKKGADVRIKNIENTSAKTQIVLDEDQEHGKNSAQQEFNDRFEGQDENNDSESLENNVGDSFPKIKKEAYNLENVKNYGIRVNENTEMIELYDKNTNKIVELIRANDLINLVQKVENASGVFFNKSI